VTGHRTCAAPCAPGVGAYLFRQLDRFRVELGLLLVVVAAGAGWWDAVGIAGAVGATTGLVAVLTALRPSRRLVGRIMWRARVRRSVLAAIYSLYLPEMHWTDPRVLQIDRTPAGEQVQLLLPRGACLPDLEPHAERLAAWMSLADLRLERDPSDARRCTLSTIRRDPLSEPLTHQWPHLDAAQLSLWDPIPVGVDDSGRIVSLTLVEHNLLLGGEPGAGKSVALSLLLATAALDPGCRLTLLDGKLVELAPWAQLAHRSVGVDVDDAVRVLRELQEEMDDRYLTLLASGQRKIRRGDALPLHVVVIDELAHYLTGGERKSRAEFADALRDLVSRGRAAGIIVLAATQKPSHDIVPTSLRDLFGFRWALRCNTPQASDTVLGAGWASQDYSASTIDAAYRGVGLLLHEGGRPVRLRAYHLDDDAVTRLIARSHALPEGTA